LIESGAANDTPFIVKPESERRLDGRIAGNGPFF
jgi:hypothetical protein